MELSYFALRILYFLCSKHAKELSIEVDSDSLCTRNASFTPLPGSWTLSDILLTTKLQEKTRKWIISEYTVVAAGVFVLYVKHTPNKSTHI